MKRRELLLLLGGTLTSARVPRAQQKAMPVIGFLNGGSADTFAPYFAAFRNGLAAMGYVDGQNVAIEYRNAEGHYDRLPAFAADLVQRNVSAIAVVSFPAVLAAKAATTTIPIFFVTGADPVAAGLVASFNRPGGNLTGISQLSPTMVTKQIELLREIVPKAELMGVVVNPTNRIHESQLAHLQAGALVQRFGCLSCAPTPNRKSRRRWLRRQRRTLWSSRFYSTRPMPFGFQIDLRSPCCPLPI